MSTSSNRRPRGSRKGTAVVFGLVDGPAGAILDDIWAAADTTKWAAVETILSYVDTQLGDQGLPEWWPADLPKRRARGDRDEGFVPVFAPVAPEAAAVLSRVASASGVAKAIALEAILVWVGTQLTDNGLPTWWPVPSFQQEALIPA